MRTLTRIAGSSNTVNSTALSPFSNALSSTPLAYGKWKQMVGARTKTPLAKTRVERAAIAFMLSYRCLVKTIT